MHEMGIMAEVLDAVTEAVQQESATKVNSITLDIGEMTEVVPDALQFAFEALSPGTVLEGASLDINMIGLKSRCMECGNEYEHDRFQMTCPQCGTFAIEILQGRELHIKSIDVDIPEHAPEALSGDTCASTPSKNKQ